MAQVFKEDLNGLLTFHRFVKLFHVLLASERIRKEDVDGRRAALMLALQG